MKINGIISSAVNLIIFCYDCSRPRAAKYYCVCVVCRQLVVQHTTLEPSTYIKQYISGYDLIHVIFDGVKTQKTGSNYSWMLFNCREVTSIICCTELMCIICQQLLWKKQLLTGSPPQRVISEYAVIIAPKLLNIVSTKLNLALRKPASFAQC